MNSDRKYDPEKLEARWPDGSLVHVGKPRLCIHCEEPLHMLTVSLKAGAKALPGFSQGGQTVVARFCSKCDVMKTNDRKK